VRKARRDEVKSAMLNLYMFELPVATKNSCPSPRSESDVTAPSVIAFLTTLKFAVFKSATVPFPVPTSKSPDPVTFKSVTPFSNLIRSGPTALRTACCTLMAITSPEVVPQYARSSFGSISITFTTRRRPRTVTVVADILAVSSFSFHTRNVSFPPVIKVSSTVLQYCTTSANPPRPLPVVELHIALPVATFQTATLPSSSPPSDTKYLPDGEKHSAWTFTR